MAENGSSFQSFWNELKRRHVFRVAAVYAVAAFAVLQAADIVFPALGLPDWTLTFIVLVALFGFPVAMVLAWVFDITARGVERTESAEPGPAGPASYRDLAIGGVVALVLISLVAGWMVLQGGVGDPEPDAPVGAELATGGDRIKLVVLPFENLGAPEDAYFAEGITDEITARLARVDRLGVIARTSAIRYRDSEKSAREIGRELGVEYILEGTVRWERPATGPSRVRVTPQLIRVADETHVWAETYDEPISSVFQVQSEIAQRVVRALNLTLGEPERAALASRPTGNVDAYTLYLRAQEALESGDPGGLRQAIDLLERTLAVDPTFELARMRLAEANANLYWSSFRTLFGFPGGPDGSGYRATLSGLDPAGLAGDTAAYLLARAILRSRLTERDAARADFDSARARLETAAASRPGEARVHGLLGLAYAGLDRADRAVEQGRLAVELSPLEEDPYAGSAWVDNLAHIHVVVGDVAAATGWLDSLLAAPTPTSVQWVRADPTWEPLRGYPEFERLLEAGPERGSR